MVVDFPCTVIGEGEICRFSVSRFSFLSIVLKSALCASKIFVVFFTLLLICLIVFSTFPILRVTVPSADTTPVADAIASVLRVIDFSLLVLMASRRR